MLPSDALPQAEQVAMLSAWLADRNIDAVVKLFVNDLTPDASTVLADFTEPSGDWYTPAAVDFNEPRETEDNGITVDATSIQYNYTGTDPAETIFGWMVVNVTPARLLSSRRLDTPVSMANVLDSVIVIPSITLGPVE